MTAENEAILKRFPEGTPYFLPLYLQMYSGLSKGEIFALSVDDLDVLVNYTIVINIKYLIKYNRDNNNLYFFKKPFKSIKIEDTIACKTIMRKLLEKRDLMTSNYRPKYAIDNYGRLIPFNFTCKTQFYPLICRSDGSYISPQGINYVTRVIQGKTSSIDIVQPNWKFDNSQKIPTP